MRDESPPKGAPENGRRPNQAAAIVSPVGDMLGEALDLAAQGWRVLPCIPTGERAKAPLLEHGFHDATLDPTVITSWWTRWPTAMIGARVPESLLIIDIDPRN